MPVLDYEDELTYTAGPPATSKQSIVGTAGTAILGGRVKDGIGAKDWGAGEILKAFLRCVTALVGATGGLQVDIVGADNAALTTNPVVLLTKTIPAASLVANAAIALGSLLPGFNKRYLGVKMTPLTTNSTAGEVIVALTGKDALPQNKVAML